MSDAEQNLSIEPKTGKVKRVITGWIVGLVSLFCFFAGGIYLLLFLFSIIYFGVAEYHKILKNKGFFSSITIIYIASFCYALLIFSGRFDLLPFALTLSIVSSFLVVLFKGRQPYIANVATTILGFMYGGWLPCHILLIRQYDAAEISIFNIQTNEGLYLLIAVFLSVVVTDIGAYYFGSRYGKHQLSPVISPKKTIEGAVGGGIFAVIVSAAVSLATNLTILQGALLGLVVTIAAQLGDLSESLIKRDAGVKDSSDILPGHGGFLDRVDGYIFALPIAYYYIAYFTHGTNLFFECFDYLKGIISAFGF